MAFCRPQTSSDLQQHLRAASGPLLRPSAPSKLVPPPFKYQRASTAIKSSPGPGWVNADDSWLSEIDRNRPAMMPPLIFTDDELMEPEALLLTNPDQAQSLGLGPVHRWVMVSADRRLVFPKDYCRIAGTPEGSLWENHKAFEGVMAPYAIGHIDFETPVDLGSITVLSAPVSCSKTSSYPLRLGVATAAHNFRSDRAYLYCADVRAFTHPCMLPFSGVDPTDKLPTLAQAAGARLFQAEGPVDDGESPIAVVKPDEQAASKAYPALKARPLQILSAPDILLYNLRMRPSKHGEAFPFLHMHMWDSEHGLDFVIPCHDNPIGKIIAVTGVAGKKLGLAPGEPPPAPELMEAAEQLPLGCCVVSPGDVVGYDGEYLMHRASATGGMGGGPVRDIRRPKLFYGIHLGTTVKAAAV
ncbi:hypothetical protein WJX73_000466 [Symbiochloris irregularis]|uniref:Uncharacterized protein n=1 Tax=Symbiochloris irregularis TaxID=706552 RepID=A0AAW1NP63_9CHLO